MGNRSAKRLLKNYNEGKCSDQEQAIVETWFLRETKSVDNHLPEPDYQSVKDKIWNVVLENNKRKVSRIVLWPRIAGAVAAVVALIVLGAYFFNASNHPQSGVVSPYANDIMPGKQGATLTLANGRKIKLTDAADGEIAKEAGIVVTKTADGQLVYEFNSQLKGDASGKFNTLTTAKGETYILTLPDKSRVWMNAASSITYAASLDEQGTRRVKLAGEAYFQVSKDSSRPFIVECKGQEVMVLGTEFNVNSYADEGNIQTTLLEGRVRVERRGDAAKRGSKNTVNLKPGEQLVNDGQTLAVSAVDVERVVAWRNGFFLFDKEELTSVMKKLSRWYNVEIAYRGNIPKKYFTGKISRYKTISEVLEILKLTESINFKIEGTTSNSDQRRVTVMP